MRNKTQDALQAEGLRRLAAAQMSREDSGFPEIDSMRFEQGDVPN